MRNLPRLFHRSVFVKCSLLSTLLLMAASLTSNTDAQSVLLPPGFVDENLITEIEFPTGLAFLPDGRMCFTTLTGGIFIYVRGAVKEIVQLDDVAFGGEDGLVSIEFDPGWPVRPFAFVYYTHLDDDDARTNRLVRLTFAGDLDDGGSTDLQVVDQYSVIDDIVAGNLTHNGGGLRFGADGTLFVAVGDCGFACDAQDLTSYHGKILRLAVSQLPPTGVGPPAPSLLVPLGNPFASVANDSVVTPLVFSYGLRNPFRIEVEPGLGLVISEVGEAQRDEINVAIGGENFGWPWLEGSLPFMACTTPAPTFLTGPIFEIFHLPFAASFAVALFGGPYHARPGGVFNFGAIYEGDIFYAILDEMAPIQRITFDGINWNFAPPVPGQLSSDIWGGVGGPVEARIGPDGAIYYVDFLGSRVGRVRPTPGNYELTVISGDLQKGNGGWPAFFPFEVELRDELGQPIPGEVIDFGIQRGGGELLETAVTGADGRATMTYRFADAFLEAPRVSATHPQANPVFFDLEWRGLMVEQAPGSVNFVIHHSVSNYPVSFAFQAPVVSAPYFTTPWGDVFTSIFDQMAGLFVVGDGFGLTRPSEPSFATGPDGRLSLSFDAIPMLGGFVFDAQAYTIDPTVPLPERVMISNSVRVTLP